MSCFIAVPFSPLCSSYKSAINLKQNQINKAMEKQNSHVNLRGKWSSQNQNVNRRFSAAIIIVILLISFIINFLINSEEINSKKN